MTRGTWGVMFMVIALVMTALGVHAGLVRGDHSAGAVGVGIGIGCLLIGASLVRK